MSHITVVTAFKPGPLFEKTLQSFTMSDLVEEAVDVCAEPFNLKIPGCRLLAAGPVQSQETLELIIGDIRTKYLLILSGHKQISIEPRDLERMLAKAESGGAGITYSDFYEKGDRGKTLHPLNDYRQGSIRDDFDFGAIMLFSVNAIRQALKKYGKIPCVKYAGLYDLRLKMSIEYPVHHLREPLYSVIGADEPKGSEKVFAYVDPGNIDVQREMETVFTDYLKNIDAYLPPESFREVEQIRNPFPVEASVVIPVLNRKNTIAEAVKSALSQDTDFPFNVIVVDNHSTDGTTAVLSDLAKQHATLKHIVPARTDLGIGGCWNEALYSRACGRYAIQLDSDDLYGSPYTLQKMVDAFRQGNYAMVIGSYTIVNFNLEEIPPGLIDHREWTDENGHNNALRINGLGAPRAFNADLMRAIGFLNVSYGEDYAAVLRICREYRIGRIYESLYLCRRWQGNTDAALAVVEVNRNDAFKDKIRTDEILARQKMNRPGREVKDPRVRGSE
ncbi:MAG: glycosyltransferase family 2 protein [Nitrospirota bacterium]